MQRYCCPTKASNPLQKIFLKQVERIFCPEFAFVGGCQHSEKSKKHPFGQAAKQQNKREKNQSVWHRLTITSNSSWQNLRLGSASVFALMQSSLFTEIVLIDADKNKAEGEAMDISHGIPFASPMKIYAGDYDDVADAAIVVISAGAGQKPGETRLDLVNKNVAIFKSIIPEIAKRNFAGIMLVVANPVDILTQVAIKLSGLPENRVIGSGTVLDSARLRYKLGEHLSVDSRSVHAFIVGEHGDSEVVAWSSANVSGVPLSEMCEMRGHYKHKENTAEIATAVKNSAYEIINKKHATYYGIAMSVKRICEVIMRDEKSILPISHMIHGVYDIDGVSLSMPAIVGADGIESDIPINLSGEEALKLKESADSLKKIMETIEL